MKIENCVYAKEEEKEYWIIINLLYFFGFGLLIRKALITDSVYYSKNLTVMLMGLMVIIIIFKCTDKNLEVIATWMITTYKRTRSNKYIGKVFQTYYRIRYKVPKTNYVYYNNKTPKEFLRKGIEILNNLPYEYKVILKKYPIILRFKYKKNSDDIGLYTIFDNDIRTSKINIYSTKDSYRYEFVNMKHTIYHEIGHHIDEVMTEVYMGGGKGEKFSDNHEDFGILFDNNEMDLWEYFLSSKSEYFAETVCLYVQGELESEPLCEFYSKMMEELMIKLR